MNLLKRGEAVMRYILRWKSKYAGDHLSGDEIEDCWRYFDNTESALKFLTHLRAQNYYKNYPHYDFSLFKEEEIPLVFLDKK